MHHYNEPMYNGPYNTVTIIQSLLVMFLGDQKKSYVIAGGVKIQGISQKVSVPLQYNIFITDCDVSTHYSPEFARYCQWKHIELNIPFSVSVNHLLYVWSLVFFGEVSQSYVSTTFVV